MFATMFATIAWPFCSETWSLVLVMGMYGFFAAGYPLSVAVISEAYYDTAPHVILTLVGAVYAMYAPGTLVGPVLVGLLAEKFDFYVAGFFCAGMFLAGNLALLWIPTPERQGGMVRSKYGISVL